MNHQPDTHVAAWLALLLFGIYLLSFSGQLYSQDSMSMFAVAESFVKRGEFNTDQLWTLFKARNEIAPDGESYAKYGYGASLFAVPLYAFAFYAPFDLGLTQTTLLTSSIVVALAGALVFLSARRFQFSRNVSIVTALLFGLATPAWVYAKQLWSEPYALATLFAGFYFLQRFRAESNARDALIAGMALGLAIATRVTNAALIPFFAWYGFSVALNDARTRRGLVWFACALGISVLSIAWYDGVRYGNPLATGYRTDETFATPILLGMYGLLFSPGKGLFIYIPALAALVFSVILFFRHARAETFLFSGIITFYVLLFSTWYYWWGGTNWGPRFLVPTIPFLILLITPAIELARARAHKLFTLLFAALCAVSFAIQLLGVAISSLAYRARMVRLSIHPEADAIFQPQFSPLVGYFNLLKPSALDLAWVRMVDNNASIDWLVIVPTLAFIVFCVLMLRRAQLTTRNPRFAISLALVLVSALTFFALYRYRGDVRFGGTDGYHALLKTIAQNEQPHDVMILNNDLVAPYFLNENRARLHWYGLSRDPQQFDDATQALLSRLSHQYARVWFAYDDAAPDLPDPTRDWLDASLHVTAEHDFDDGVHLILYATGLRP